MKKFLIFISVLFALPVYAQSNRATLQSDNSATFINCGTHCITGPMLQNWNNLSIQSFGVLQDGNTWTGLNNFTGGIEINGVPAIFPAYAANNTALSAWPSTAGPVTRLGYATPGDSTTVTYAAQAVCPYAGTQPDGGACVPTSDGKFWVLQTNGEVDARVWGAKCNANGANTDDSAAINQAFAVAGASRWTIVFPNSPCRASAGISQPVGANARGVSFVPGQDYGISAPNTYTGSGVVCDLTVTPCWMLAQTYSGTGHVGGQKLSDITIYRAAGSVTTSQECLLDRSWWTTVTNVFCNGHSNGFHRYGTNGYGLISTYENVGTCNISGSDLVMDGTAEWKISHGRFGCNHDASRITAHNNYVLITGSASAPGPNTLMITDSMFNDDLNPTCTFNWSNISGTIPSVTEFRFRGNHMEFTGQPGSPHTVFCTDGSLAQILDVAISDNTFWDFNGTGNVFGSFASFGAWPSNVSLASWKFNSNFWGGFITNGWTLNTTQPVYDLTVANDVFTNATVSISMPSGSGVNFSGEMANGLIISGAPAQASFSGAVRAGSCVTTGITTPQAVSNTIPSCSMWASYTPVVTCGTGSLTSYTATGSYVVSGKTTSFQINIVITTVGTCAGTISVSTPTYAASSSNIPGRERAFTGNSWIGQLGSGSAVMGIARYDNNTALTAGYILSFSGSYSSQ